MSGKKTSKIGRVRAILAGFLVLIGIFTGVSGTILSNDVVYAVGENSETSTEETSNADTETKNDKEEKKEDNQKDSATTTAGDNCKKSLGALGWVVCPSTGKIAEAVDWLYNKIEEFLVVSPVSAEDGSPIYEIWKYCRGLTNIVFIIFLLIVIYSQITGLGISNYGIKKTLPKLIVTAVLVNLSFLICSLAVDASNIIGNSLRGVFTSVEEATLATGASELGPVSVSSVYTTLASGGTLAIGATAIAFDLGMIWMLIPVALGAIVAVVTGLITISLRQAVVVLLIMVSPLAMVAYILPNTEQWFKKWKDLLTKMLVFYPMFSLLFGASSLAGFALIMSAKDGIGLLLGIAVQIFPLFFAWKLMQMSGTFLGGINAKIRGIAAKPLATNRAWAESHRDNRKAARLAKDNVYAPNTRLMQFMNNRKVMREADTTEYLKHAEKRGLAYRAGQNWKGAGANGKPTRKGMSVYTRQAQGLEYSKIIERDKNTMNKGLGYLAKEGTIEHARLDKLDAQMVSAADTFKMEQARGEKIEYENAMGFHKRMEDAMNAHMDMENGFTRDKDGKIIGRRDGYKFHMDPSKLEKSAELARYNAAYQIMEGNVGDVQYAVATAAQGYDTQKKIYEGKMQKYFELTAPTQDVVNRMNELTVLSKNDIKDGQKATANIDAIVAGMRILNQRGDTDLLKAQLDNILDKNIGGGLELGTHASQALASFLMFEVKGGDPALRRFGKYINLETARMYNESDDQRQEKKVTYDEYIKGYHEEPNGKRMYAKKDSRILLEGTSLDDIERTALSNLDDSLKKAYGYKKPKEGEAMEPWDVEGYLRKREELQTAMEPAFLSSSLKWPSGSEQINSGVKFWTGYEQKQKKDKDGNLMVDDKEEPIYELTPVWKGKEFAGHEKEVEEYYRKKTEDYFKDQTTGQILNMRTDYREPAIEHLLEMYFNDEGADEELGSRRREYERERAEIQTRYGDEADVEVAKDKRNKDMTKLRRKIAGRQLRKILDGTGKLETIYTNRRSGATINAKDWLRQMLNLDDKEEMYKYLNEKDYRKGRKGKGDKKEELRGLSGDDAGDYSLDDGGMTLVGAKLDKLFGETGDYADPDEGFYNESLSIIKEEFGNDSIVVAEYKDYKKDNAKASRSELKDKLDRILKAYFDERDK